LSTASTVAARSIPTDWVARALLNRLSMRLALVVLVASFLLPTAGLGVEICWFKGMFGLPCPGCGMTRSLTSVSHLEIGQALHYHPFGLVVWLLVLGLAVANFVGRERRDRVGRWLVRHRQRARTGYLGFVYAFVAFGVIRLAVAYAVPGAFAGI